MEVRQLLDDSQPGPTITSTVLPTMPTSQHPHITMAHNDVQPQTDRSTTGRRTPRRTPYDPSLNHTIQILGNGRQTIPSAPTTIDDTRVTTHQPRHTRSPPTPSGNTRPPALLGQHHLEPLLRTLPHFRPHRPKSLGSRPLYNPRGHGLRPFPPHRQHIPNTGHIHTTSPHIPMPLQQRHTHTPIPMHPQRRMG